VAKVIYASEADGDLEAILDYLADNPMAARNFATKNP
jgi:plasmid stabilization system protein ParE